MIKKCVGIIGCGNMGQALLARLVTVTAKNVPIIVSEKDAARRNRIGRKYRTVVLADTAHLLRRADVVILAVKPAEIEDLLQSGDAAGISGKTLVISIAAGITTGLIENSIGKKARVIRVMPNMPATIGEGVSSLSAGSSATRGDMELAKEIFRTIGDVVEVDEKLVDAVTAVSGSGPAYFFYLAETLIAAAQKVGLSGDLARRLVIKTGAGSTRLLAVSQEDPAALRARVTSKGGTTEAAFKVFTAKKFDAIVRDAVKAAVKRSHELRKGR